VDANHLRDISRILAHKWDLTILARLAERPLRYTELAHEVREVDSDLTEGVLSKNLKRLAVTGLIRQEPTNNHRHVWNLTPHGRDMVEILGRITGLGDQPPPREGLGEEPSPDGPGSDGDDEP
jgi:DNA-binding HxlR family transcriptional regulator